MKREVHNSVLDKCSISWLSGRIDQFFWHISTCGKDTQNLFRNGFRPRSSRFLRFSPNHMNIQVVLVWCLTTPGCTLDCCAVGCNSVTFTAECPLACLWHLSDALKLFSDSTGVQNWEHSTFESKGTVCIRLHGTFYYDDRRVPTCKLI